MLHGKETSPALTSHADFLGGDIHLYLTYLIDAGGGMSV